MAYNLELFGGRFHSDFWFAAAWGAFPAFTAYWVNSLSVDAAGVLVAAACFGLSVAQRALSTPVRELRRRTVSVTGEQRLQRRQRRGAVRCTPGGAARHGPAGDGARLGAAGRRLSRRSRLAFLTGFPSE